jgi:hypothetical protein
MSKPQTKNQTVSKQTPLPRVALGEGIVQDQRPRKRQKTNHNRRLTGNEDALACDHSVRPICFPFLLMDVRHITPDHVRRWFEGLADF